MSGVVVKQKYEADCPECGEPYFYEKIDFYQEGFDGFLNQRCDSCQYLFTVWLD